MRIVQEGGEQSLVTITEYKEIHPKYMKHDCSLECPNLPLCQLLQ